MKKKISVSLLLASLFIYLAFRNVDWHEALSILRSADYRYVLLTTLLTVFILYLRSYRWGLILAPLRKIDQGSLFSITSVGFMAIDLLPVRVGEFVRPYLISQKSGIRMSSSLATILVERIYDFASLVIILMVALLFVQLPLWVSGAGVMVVAIILPLLVLLTLIAMKREASIKMIDMFVSKLPDVISLRLRGIVPSFLDGLEILPDLRRSLSVALTSLLIWMVNGFSIYFLFFSFGFRLPLVAAYVVLVIIALGLVLPAGPGFVGNFHFFCVMALALFGIPKTQALTFAILLHFTQILPIIICGLCFLPFHRLSFPSLFQSSKNIGNL